MLPLAAEFKRIITYSITDTANSCSSGQYNRIIRPVQENAG